MTQCDDVFFPGETEEILTRIDKAVRDNPVTTQELLEVMEMVAILASEGWRPAEIIDGFVDMCHIDRTIFERIAPK
jgi:hypothetical protein